jgi:hypothetical protein
MGFAVGGSFVAGYIPQGQQQQYASPDKNYSGQQPSTEERHEAIEKAIAFYNKLLAWFTGILAIATVILGIATVALYFGSDKQFALGERAFVSLDGFVAELTTAAHAPIPEAMLPPIYKTDPGLYLARCALIPKWKNSGRTPTKNMTIQVNWGGPYWTVISPDSFTYRTAPIPFFVPPGGEELSPEIPIQPARALIDWSFHPVEPRPLILIWGRADYEDVFGKRHVIEWCRELRLDRHDGRTLRASFIQWGDYNRTYEPT